MTGKTSDTLSVEVDYSVNKIFAFIPPKKIL